MIVLTLDNRKLLPPGVHDASLKEVEELFGRFQRTERRPKLFGKLRDFLKAIEKADIAASVIIDGSFVMACVDEPGDIDLIVVLSKEWDWEADLKPYQYNLMSKRRIKQEFGFDVFVVSDGAADEAKWTKFFTDVEPKWCKLFGWSLESKKGVVRVQP